MASKAVFTATSEAAIAVEDDPGDADFVDGVGGPAVEGVCDDAVGAAMAEEVGEGVAEGGGIGEGRRRHIDGSDGAEGFAGGKLEGVEVDVEAGLLVAIDGFVEDDDVVWEGNEGGSDAVGCEESGEI